MIDIEKANESYISIKEKRIYQHLPFKAVLGRSQVNLEGRRTDMGVTANSLSRGEICDLPP